MKKSYIISIAVASGISIIGLCVAAYYYRDSLFGSTSMTITKMTYSKKLIEKYGDNPVTLEIPYNLIISDKYEGARNRTIFDEFEFEPLKIFKELVARKLIHPEKIPFAEYEKKFVVALKRLKIALEETDPSRKGILGIIACYDKLLQVNKKKKNNKMKDEDEKNIKDFIDELKIHAKINPLSSPQTKKEGEKPIISSTENTSETITPTNSGPKPIKVDHDGEEGTTKVNSDGIGPEISTEAA